MYVLCEISQALYYLSWHKYFEQFPNQLVGCGNSTSYSPNLSGGCQIGESLFRNTSSAELPLRMITWYIRQQLPEINPTVSHSHFLHHAIESDCTKHLALISVCQGTMPRLSCPPPLLITEEGVILELHNTKTRCSVFPLGLITFTWAVRNSAYNTYTFWRRVES